MAAGCVITIGNFDGVHLGHRAILARARALGRQAGVPVRALTFDPHPARVLRPAAEPPMLMSVPQRLAALRDAGADEALILEPTPQLLSQTAQEFIDWLVQTHRPVAVVEGAEFRFGRGRQGDMALLAAAGRSAGFEAVAVEPVQVALQDLLLAPVSSSLVRWLLGLGRVGDAARCLGRWYALSGTVAQGEQRGRTLGVPTVNLDVAALTQRVIPADGVYAGVVDLADGRRFPAAISIGSKPTFGQARRLIESHLLGFAGGELYGQSIGVHLCRWLRDQQRFPGVEELQRQLTRDVAAVRRLHGMGLLETACEIGVATDEHR